MFVYHGNEMVDEISATKKDEEYEDSLVCSSLSLHF